MFEELSWSMKWDPIAKQLLGPYRQHVLKFLDGDGPTIEKIDRVKHVYEILEKQYFDEVIRQIGETIEHGKCKDLISSLASCFTTELVNDRCTQLYAYLSIKNFFFPSNNSRPFTKINQLNQYFTKFNGEKLKNRKWKIVVKCCKNWKLLSDVFTGAPYIDLRFDKPDFAGNRRFEKSFYSENEDHLFIVFSEIVGKEKFEVKTKVQQAVGLLGALLQANMHSVKLDVEDDILVYADDNKAYIVSQSITPAHRRIDPPKRQGVKNFAKSLSLFSSLVRPSVAELRFPISLEYHTAALNSKRNEEQLVNLWTAIEALAPTGEPQKIINKVKKFVLPLLCNQYPKSLLKDFLRYIKYYGDKGSSDILASVPVEGGAIIKMAALFSLEEMDDHGKKLLKYFADNPLIRYRMHCLKTMFGSGRSLSNKIKNYRMLVGWQLERIYRTRSNIVHTGSYPTNLDILIENLHYYYDMVVKGIEIKLSNNRNIISLENVYWESAKDYQDWQADLKNKADEAMTRNNFETLALGRFALSGIK